MFKSTYTVQMISFDGRPNGDPVIITGEDEHRQDIADMVGLVRATQTAGWPACVSGRADVHHHESGRRWVVRVEETR